MKSYNCFYSALFEVLEQYFFEKTHLLINNRWQFFYKKSDTYTDDRRILGEWPLLFDDWHLKQLYERVGINIIFKKCMVNSINSFLNETKKVPVIMFVNKMNILTNLSAQLENKCVTTIIVNEANNEVIHCQVFEKDLDTIENIDVDILYYAWLAASDYECFNKCNILIEYLERGNLVDIEEFAKLCMKSSLINFMTLNNKGNIYPGIAGMRLFSKDIFRWERDFFKRLIDCSMYIDIIIRQRTLFVETLKEIHIGSEKVILEKALVLIRKWKNMKMIFYIVGTRRQKGAIRQIYEMVIELINLESDLINLMINNL